MRGEQTKKAGSGAGMAAVNAAATAQLLSYQEPPSTTPNVVLQWRSIGARKNISGYAVSSELFAFLGTDTRTKTRMLQTIAGLTEPSPSSSSSSSIDTPPVTLNGVPLTAPPVNSSWLDVQDAVHLYENLSVLETLVFSAEMRLGTGPSSAAATTGGGGGHGHAGSGGPRRSTEVAGYSRHQPAELLAVRLLTEMGLEDIAETRVGDLPAWQRRVTLFATEVIAGRDVLFFDRPTSDLDAQSALAVVTSLQRIARGNRLVAITAATLTFREYAILDRIQLLSKNGAIYYGLGSGALAYFEKLSRTPSPGASISDFLLDLVDEVITTGCRTHCIRPHTRAHTLLDHRYTTCHPVGERHLPGLPRSAGHLDAGGHLRGPGAGHRAAGQGAAGARQHRQPRDRAPRRALHRDRRLRRGAPRLRPQPR